MGQWSARNRGRARGSMVVAAAAAAATTATALVLACPHAARGAVVYGDDFNRPLLAGGSYTYTTTVLGGDGGAAVVGDQLQLTNDATAGANNNGIVFVTTPTSGYGSNFNNVLSANTGRVLTWSFNLQQPHTNPGGFTAGAYGVAYVLGSSSSALKTAGVGYAVVIGNGGTIDPVRLVRFSAGLDSVGTSASSTDIYLLASGTSSPTHYHSVQVSYRPATSTWALLDRDDGTTGFVNPTDPTNYVLCGTAVDTTYTSVPLTHSGAYWDYGNTAQQKAVFDNIMLDVSTDGGGLTTPRQLVFDGDGAAGSNPSDVGGAWESSGHWWDAGTSANVDWRSDLPDNATFGTGAGAGGSAAVTLSSSQTAGHVTFAAASPTYALGGSGTLTLSGGVSANESASIGCAVSLPAGAGQQAWDVAAQQTLTVTGVLTAAAGGGINKTGGGTLVLAAMRGRGALSVSGGVVRLASNGTPAGTSTLGTVAVAAGATLDLRDNALVVGATPAGTWNGAAYTGISALIAQARNGGDWTGDGITTTAAAPADYTTLGVATAADALGIASTATGIWSGQTVTGSDALVMYTYGGDANLDGVVNIDDYTQIDSSVSVGGMLKGWYNGDFNYDGNVDIDDYTIIDSNITIQGPPLSGAAPAAPPAGVAITATPAVPEPTTAVLVTGLATARLLPRRRRRP